MTSTRDGLDTVNRNDWISRMKMEIGFHDTYIEQLLYCNRIGKVEMD